MFSIEVAYLEKKNCNTRNYLKRGELRHIWVQAITFEEKKKSAAWRDNKLNGSRRRAKKLKLRRKKVDSNDTVYPLTDRNSCLDATMEPVPFTEELSERKVCVVGSELVENYTVRLASAFYP